MFYQPITPFRRAMAAAPVQPKASRALPDHAVDKWDALRELAVARKTFGLSDRDLAVLQALLSFHPGTKLDDPGKLVVFPSNAKLCERLNGMPCSTMRRHLAHLVDAAVIVRRDSPNGKRYRRREGQSFGFDLAPLAYRFAEIHRAADMVRTETHRIQILREQISLLRRDLLALLKSAPDAGMSELAQLSAKALRRQMTMSQLESLHGLLVAAVDNFAASSHFAQDPSSDDSQNEHHQYSKISYIPESVCAEEQPDADLQLAEVLESCSQFQQLSPDPIKHWADLVCAAENIRPMMGICPAAWQHAVGVVGKVSASVLLAAILQRFESIRSPGAYLRGLVDRAGRQDFSLVRLVRGSCGKFTAVNTWPGGGMLAG